MNSMTGFGRSALQNITELEGVIEVTSVNRKNLDVVHSCPKDWVGLDSILLNEVKKHLKRGRISISIRVKLLDSNNGGWSENSLKQELQRFKQFAENEGLDLVLDANFLAQIAYNNTQNSELPEWSSIQDSITQALQEALEALCVMRANEGKALLADFESRIKQMITLKNEISEHSVGMVEQYRDRLFERLKASGLELDLDDERVLKEIAIFSDRCDINEELTRLDSHYRQFLETANTDGSIGRKLEFITQEIGRELNTIGSKSNKLEISKAVIESKNQLESIREQVLNVE